MPQSQRPTLFSRSSSISPRLAPACSFLTLSHRSSKNDSSTCRPGVSNIPAFVRRGWLNLSEHAESGVGNQYCCGPIFFVFLTSLHILQRWHRRRQRSRRHRPISLHLASPKSRAKTFTVMPKLRLASSSSQAASPFATRLATSSRLPHFRRAKSSQSPEGCSPIEGGSVSVGVAICVSGLTSAPDCR